MNFSRAFWFLVILYILSGYIEGPALARGLYWTSRYWYGVARFAGGMGLRAENAYHEEMERVRG